MSSVVAIVKSIIGQVFAESLGGGRRVLVEGDRVFQGELILTGESGAVSLDTGNGKTVDLGRDSRWSGTGLVSTVFNDSHHMSKDVANLLKAFGTEFDPTLGLAATAAGPVVVTGGNINSVGGGHTFVMLTETAGRVDPTIGFATRGLEGHIEGSEERQPGMLHDPEAENTDANDNTVSDHLNFTTLEDTPLNGVFGHQGGTYVISQDPTKGQLVLTPEGTWQYVPNDNYNGGDSFTVVVTDNHGVTSTITVTIGITPVNDAPVALPGTATTDENTVLNAQVPVASDVDGTISGYQLFTDVAPHNGALNFNPDGSYSFNPGTDFDHLAPGQTQDVTFTYQAKDNDGTLSDPQTITITVTGTNDAPVALPGSASTDENTVLNAQVPVASDVDGTISGYQLFTDVAPHNGALTFNPDGSYSFNPGTDFDHLAPGQSQDVTFTYQARDNDGTLSDPQTITITVTGTNDAPVALPGTATTDENTVLNAQVPVATDVDGSVAGYQLTTDVGAHNGSLTFNPDGSYSFNPGTDFDHLTPGQTQDVTFTYQAKDNDGTLSDPQTITITVTGTNDAPVALPGTATTDENTVLNAQVPVASDADGTISGYQLITDVAPHNGALTFNPDGSYSFNPGTDFDHLVPGQTQDVTFTYQATDNDGALSDPRTITITVTGTNDAPVALPDFVTTKEDTSVQISLLGNDSDPEGDSLSVTSATAPNGVVTINPDGTLTYSPKTNFSGSDTITYSISDGHGGTSSSIVTVFIEAVADQPNLALNTSIHQPPSTGLTWETWTGLPLGTSGLGADPNLLQSTIDHAGAPNTSSSVNNILNGAGPVGTANKISGLIYLEAGHVYAFGGAGDDSIRLVIGGAVIAESTWGQNNSGSFTGAFTPPQSGYYTLEFYQHNQRADGNYYLAGAVDGVNAHLIDISNTLLYHNTGELTAAGERLSDLIGSNGDGYYVAYGPNEGNEDTSIPLSQINASLVDTDGSETLSISVGHIPDGAILSDGINSFTADATHTSVDVSQWNLNSLTFTPPANFNGTIKLEVSTTSTEQSNHDAATRTLDLNIQVHAVNDAPTAAATQTFNTLEDTPFNGQVQAFDVDHDSLTYALKSGGDPSHGTVAFGSDGHYTYTPGAHYIGGDNFTLVISDGHGGTVEQAITVGVNPTSFVLMATHLTATIQETPSLASKLIGDAGNDTLMGGKGDDILSGSAGADTFVWRANDAGNDTIIDFKPSEGDRLDLSDLLPAAAHNDLLSYLKVDTATSTIAVSTSTSTSTSGHVDTAADVTIKLNGVDLNTYGANSAEIVNKLVAGADPLIRTEHH